MANKKTAKTSGDGYGARLRFEAKMWLAADKLRNNMDAAKYKHVVLGLIFLKCIGKLIDDARVAKAIRKNLQGLGYVG